LNDRFLFFLADIYSTGSLSGISSCYEIIVDTVLRVGVKLLIEKKIMYIF